MRDTSLDFTSRKETTDMLINKHKSYMTIYYKLDSFLRPSYGSKQKLRGFLQKKFPKIKWHPYDMWDGCILTPNLKLLAGGRTKGFKEITQNLEER